MHTRALSPVVPTAAVLGSMFLAGCWSSPPPGPPEPLNPPALSSTPVALTQFAASSIFQWTGVAVSRDGRVFVCYPRWPGPHEFSVAELRNGSPRAYPDAAWNSWRPDVTAPPPPDPAAAFVCVQALTIDSLNRLWVLDPASPNLAGVVPGGPKLVQIDLTTDRPVRTYHFDLVAAPVNSYLNDVRVDAKANMAYITDSGAGALVVLDLVTGAARRVLADHPSTKAEEGVVPVIEGREVRLPDGSPPRVNVDGLALDTAGGFLYYQALCARTLYRIPTRVLNDFNARGAAIAAAVENVGQSVMTDGMEIDSSGNLYFAAIELGAIVVRHPDGRYATVAPSPEPQPIVESPPAPRISWPDSIAFVGAAGTGSAGGAGAGASPGDLLVTASQIHRSPLITGSTTPPSPPYLILRIPAAALP